MVPLSLNFHLGKISTPPSSKVLRVDKYENLRDISRDIGLSEQVAEDLDSSLGPLAVV